jgi:hypothetical protein
MKNKNFGLYCSLACVIVYIFLNVYVIAKLPIKLDTFLLFSWLVVPGIIGGLVFYHMDKNGLWGESK